MSGFPEPNPAQREAATDYEQLRGQRRFYEAAQLLRSQYEQPEGGEGFVGEVFRLRYLRGFN